MNQLTDFSGEEVGEINNVEFCRSQLSTLSNEKQIIVCHEKEINETMKNFADKLQILPSAGHAIRNSIMLENNLTPIINGCSDSQMHSIPISPSSPIDQSLVSNVITENKLDREECSLSLDDKNEKKFFNFTLLTLPQFNLTKIINCLGAKDRLRIFARVHRKLYKYALNSKCFSDMSFFPVQDQEVYYPRILSVQGTSGITYVEVNIHSKHPFVQRVALKAGMWNFRADLWNKLKWPATFCIESLQVTIDHVSSSRRLKFDQPPAPFNSESDISTQTTTIRDNSWAQDNQQNNLDTVTDGVYNSQDRTEKSNASHIPFEPFTFDDCASLIKTHPLPYQYRIKNLFFIRFDHESYQPEIMFPTYLMGLGLQSFDSICFSSSWWKTQVFEEHRFNCISFLVLSSCTFEENELQMLIKNCESIQHLSLRFVKWEGTIYFPQQLVSLGYYPDNGSENSFSLQNCTNIWQIQTRLNENCRATVNLLNRARLLSKISRICFEYIRQQQPWLPDIDLQLAEKWEDKKHMQIVLKEEDLTAHPKLKEIFNLPNENFVLLNEKFDFADCPLWSPESLDFIKMTKERKLLLR